MPVLQLNYPDNQFLGEFYFEFSEVFLAEAENFCFRGSPCEGQTSESPGALHTNYSMMN